jgi:hypothetical protein
MLDPANLFRLLNELVFLLLGPLLVWVAWTGRYFFNRRAPTWIGLGAFLIYWGLRAWWRASRPASRRELAPAAVRGGSLALVGAMMLGIAWLPFAWVGPLLGAAGGILIVRGLVSAVLVARTL